MVLHAARRARNLRHDLHCEPRKPFFGGPQQRIPPAPAALVKMSVDRAWKGLMHKVDSRRQLPDDPARGNISPIRSLASVNSEHDFRDEVRTPSGGGGEGHAEGEGCPWTASSVAKHCVHGVCRLHIA